MSPPVVQYTDVEKLVKQWLLGTGVAALVQRSDGGFSIYQAMPKASPIPSVVLTLIAANTGNNDQPTMFSRVQFDCWGTTRDQAAALSLTLISELESLSRSGNYTDGATLLASASVLMHRWFPDPDSDTPRYIVDALITTVT